MRSTVCIPELYFTKLSNEKVLNNTQKHKVLLFLHLAVEIGDLLDACSATHHSFDCTQS